jgi:hypothetical protein
MTLMEFANTANANVRAHQSTDVLRVQVAKDIRFNAADYSTLLCIR